jgi:ubiquinone/menaquinone biosynthesis C-methylase UbiE
MDTSLSPLHTQNPLNRFSDRATDYARARPSYPTEAIDLILTGLEQPSQLTVADIGAGTGISARLLADRGAKVLAIEPNAAMREAAEPHPLVDFLSGTAEQTGLPDRSVDLVLCCQSFHWFEPVSALSEFHRILKPTGQVALMWNERNLDDEFTQQYSDIVRAAADRQVFDRPDRKSAEPLATSPLFTHYRSHTVTHSHRLNLESLTGLVLSSSYIPTSGAAYDRLIQELQDLYQRWVNPAMGDYVALSFRTNIYLVNPVAIDSKQDS